MAYRMCFICSNEIYGFFEHSSKKQSSAGTLCELLGLQLRDSTFTFGSKFIQAPYCPQCVSKMKEIRQMFNSLKELENNIKYERKIIENQLRKTCEKRRVLLETNDEDDDEDDEDSFHPFDKFREDVMKEIDGPNDDMSCGSGNLPQQKLKKIERSTFKKCLTEPMKRLKVEISRCNSEKKGKRVQQSSEKVESDPTNFRRGRGRPRKDQSVACPESKLQNKREDEEIDSDHNEVDPEVNVVVAHSTSASTVPSENDPLNTGEVDLLSAGFYSIVYGEDGNDNSEQGDNVVEEVNSDMDDTAQAKRYS